MSTPFSVFGEVLAERVRQNRLWGEQNHPDGTGATHCCDLRDVAKWDCDRAFSAGQGTWFHILDEEVKEALAESDPHLLRAELIQVAAVAIQWVQAIDRRHL